MAQQQVWKAIPVPTTSVVLNICEARQLYNAGMLGAIVWPSAQVLVECLAEPPFRKELVGSNVLELGSGCGVVGFAASVLGARRVLLTDKNVKTVKHHYEPDGTFEVVHADPETSMLDAIRRNLQENAGPLEGKDVAVKHLAWGDPEDMDACRGHFRGEGLDFVIGSDITYHSLTHRMLFETVRELALASSRDEGTPPTRTRVLFGHHHRGASSLDGLLEASRHLGFACDEVLRREDAGPQASSVVSVFQFTLDLDSLDMGTGNVEGGGIGGGASGGGAWGEGGWGRGRGQVPPVPRR